MKIGDVEPMPEFKPDNGKKIADEAFIKLHADGYHNAEIARRLGVTSQTVKNRLDALGLVPNVLNISRRVPQEETPVEPEDISAEDCMEEMQVGAGFEAPETGASRSEILYAAMRCVCGEREEDYGSPEQNFGIIASFWEAYLKGKCIGPDGRIDIFPEDVAAMLALLKIARISSGHGKRDNWVDLAGYAACGGELEAM